MNRQLTDLCLDTIAKNFIRYNQGFTTNDEHMKRELEFLQRKYSSDLIERLCNSDHVLPVEFVDFLINKYLTVLDTTWINKCSWEKVSSKISEIGHNIEKISFSKMYFGATWEEYYKPPWQDIICYLPNLKSFRFHAYCHDLILTNIAKFCPNIEEIKMQSSTITFEGVKYLYEHGNAPFTKLKKLLISGTPIELDDVKYLLKNLPSLEFIDYRKLPHLLYSLHEKDLFSLHKVKPYNITTLSLMGVESYLSFVNILKVCLSVCPHLKILSCALTNKDNLTLFSNLFDLEQLQIESLIGSEIDINDFLKSNCQKLTSLTVRGCAVSVSVLAESCPCLKELTLDNACLYYDDDSKVVFYSLTSLVITNSNVSGNVREISLLLSSSEKLESLSFTCCNLFSSELKTDILKCCKLYSIKKISFCYSDIEKEYVENLLLNCPTLSYLNVAYCFFIDDEDEFFKFVETLSKKPEIDITEDGQMDLSDIDEYLSGENFVSENNEDYLRITKYVYDDDDDDDMITEDLKPLRYNSHDDDMHDEDIFVNII